MRFLVTGGAGFIGSALTRHIVGATAHEAVVVDKLTYAGNLDSLAPVADDDRYRFIRADIADGPRMRDLVEAAMPDVIIHLAAETHVDRSIDGAGAFVQTNLVGTSVLLDVALAYWRSLPAGRRDAFRFLHVSTDEVFGSLDGGAGAFAETSSYRPNSPYAASKAGSDHLVRAWHRTYGLPVVISNCSNNYGPYQFPEKLIPLMILNGLEGKKLPVYGQGQNVRDWLFVEDHVRALLLIAEKGEVGESYNVGGNCERTNIDVVKNHLPADGRDHPRCGHRPARKPGHLRRRPAGPRPALRHRRDQDPRPPELAAAGELRDRAGKDRALVSRQSRLVAARASGRLSRRTAGSGALILVFGGNGQLGRELAGQAKATGVALMGLGHREADIADAAVVEAAIAAAAPSLIVNAAAYNAVDDAESDVVSAMRVNAEGPGVLAAAATRHGIPLVHVSTDYVFDGEKGSPYDEDDAIGPLGAYARSKAEGEAAVRRAAPAHYILRTAWLFSIHGANFLKLMVKLAQEKPELKAASDQTSSPTAARDLADAILLLATQGEGRFGTYHLAGTGAATRHEWASAVVAAQAPFTGKAPPVHAVPASAFPAAARRPRYTALDCSKFAATFGFRPRIWQDGVKDTVAELFAKGGTS